MKNGFLLAGIASFFLCVNLFGQIAEIDPNLPADALGRGRTVSKSGEINWRNLIVRDAVDYRNPLDLTYEQRNAILWRHYHLNKEFESLGFALANESTQRTEQEIRDITKMTSTIRSMDDLAFFDYAREQLALEQISLLRRSALFEAMRQPEELLVDLLAKEFRFAKGQAKEVAAHVRALSKEVSEDQVEILEKTWHEYLEELPGAVTDQFSPFRECVKEISINESSLLKLMLFQLETERIELTHSKRREYLKLAEKFNSIYVERVSEHVELVWQDFVKKLSDDVVEKLINGQNK